MKVLDPGPDVVWLGHDSFRISGEKVVYIDPIKMEKPAIADIILITHDHYDHCVPEDVARLSGPETVIAGPAEVAAKLKGHKVQIVKPGDKVTVKGIAIEGVPAYNLTKFRSPGKPFHPKAEGKMGYIVTIGGRRVYHSGDTDLIPEMSLISCDIALLPVSGTYVMTAEEAAQAANLIKPKMAVPMHYADIVGTEHDAEHFKELAKVPVTILKKEAG
jgi:L-ascorbate metabolism protein UlaG (beta-lactamase superfamily)